MNSHKPKKRVMAYWLVKYGIFFLFASFYLCFYFLFLYTYYHSLASYFLMMSFIALGFGLILLFAKWAKTNYFFLKSHIYIKTPFLSRQISYRQIKKAGSCNCLLEKMLGITNIYIETLGNKTYYLNGIKSNAAASELIQKISK